MTRGGGSLGSPTCRNLRLAQGLHPQGGSSSSARDVPKLGTEAELEGTFILKLPARLTARLTLSHCLIWRLQVPTRAEEAGLEGMLAFVTYEHRPSASCLGEEDRAGDIGLMNALEIDPSVHREASKFKGLPCSIC